MPSMRKPELDCQPGSKGGLYHYRQWHQTRLCNRLMTRTVEGHAQFEMVKLFSAIAGLHGT